MSGKCDSFTKSGSACLTSSDITVGTYTGKDVVSLLNAFVDGGNVHTDSLEGSFPPKRWKYDSSGNIEFDE